MIVDHFECLLRLFLLHPKQKLTNNQTNQQIKLPMKRPKAQNDLLFHIIKGMTPFIPQSKGITPFIPQKDPKQPPTVPQPPLSQPYFPPSIIVPSRLTSKLKERKKVTFNDRQPQSIEKHKNTSSSFISPSLDYQRIKNDIIRTRDEVNHKFNSAIRRSDIGLYSTEQLGTKVPYSQAPTNNSSQIQPFIFSSKQFPSHKLFRDQDKGEDLKQSGVSIFSKKQQSGMRDSRYIKSCQQESVLLDSEGKDSKKEQIKLGKKQLGTQSCVFLQQPSDSRFVNSNYQEHPLAQSASSIPRNPHSSKGYCKRANQQSPESHLSKSVLFNSVQPGRPAPQISKSNPKIMSSISSKYKAEPHYPEAVSHYPEAVFHYPSKSKQGTECSRKLNCSIGQVSTNISSYQSRYALRPANAKVLRQCVELEIAILQRKLQMR